jgi:protocatechuate 3,4-dioxygenase beta subunit
MGLLQNLTNRVFGAQTSSSAKQKNAFLRKCYFEVMEQRRVLSADPVVAGVTYLEGDEGGDTLPDHFEVTFEGGSETTQLSQFVINGDQDLSGTLSSGDIFFDADSNEPGTADFHGFVFDATNSSGVSASDILSATVSDDGLSLTVDVDNFEAGDVLAFTIDVDEVEGRRNDRIASGVEFEGTHFTATFDDAHFTFDGLDVETQTTLIDGQVQDQTEGIFFDEFDDLLAEGEDLSNGLLDLTRDNQEGLEDRTAGAIDVYELVPRPIEISGTVFHDANLNWVQDSDEEGIANVEIRLQQLNEATGQYEDVAQTTTDANGDYSFGQDLGLPPGEYQIVQVQPEDYLDVGAAVGTVEGTESGEKLDDASGNENILTGISIPLGGTAATDFDFKEILPASVHGTVYEDFNDNGVQDGDEEGISDVLIQLFDLDGELVSEMRTDANGDYWFTDLIPGEYKIRQTQPDEYVDGRETLGTVDGQSRGSHPEDDVFCVHLEPGDRGINYDFGERLLASVHGTVYEDFNDNGVQDAGEQGISNVLIQLFDTDGDLVSEMQTDANGDYWFTDLAPGEYKIRQTQPDGYIDGQEALGTVDGQSRGLHPEDDVFCVHLEPGDRGINYDFGELLPASVHGTVYHDFNDNGVQDSDEEGISDVLIQLFDTDGELVSEMRTDANGDYWFTDLAPGEYKIRQTQPDGYIDGQEALGTVDGQSRGLHPEDDVFCVHLEPGDRGINYDFGELLPASVHGTVYHDFNDNGVQDSDEEGISDVLIQLFDTDGELVSEMRTDANGDYWFTDLAPGEYKIRQTQPDGFFDAQEALGTVDGLDRGSHPENDVFCVHLEPGDRGINYDFGELIPAEIHGRVFFDGPAFETEDGTLPENFRDQRDAIFTAGVDTPLEGVELQLFFFIDNATGEIAPRAVTLADVDASFYQDLGTTDPNALITTRTDSEGNYWFQGLQPGNYIVLETQPEGFEDSTDVVGSTTGQVFDPATAAPPSFLLNTFTTTQLSDAVVNIRVNSGGNSVANNFSEVLVQTLPPDPSNPQLPVDSRPTPTGNPLTPRPGITSYPGLFGSQPSAFTQFVGTSRGASFQTQATPTDPFSWHLSVVNGGLPRAVGAGNAAGSESIFQQAGYINSNDWNRFDMTAGTWTFTETRDFDGTISKTAGAVQFGMIGGTPLAGDFDGDGEDELAVFMDGYWMIDINSNGKWDETDLLAKLGDSEDRPVVGDWDGDGKDDIGIYGPMWERDPEAIDNEPGLPNPDNDPFTKPKNVPPVAQDATNGARIMKLTSHGQQRADVVDHVFGVDDGEKIPVTGDWNGNGIRSIGTFEDGVWRMDVNGDGEFDHQDRSARFGQAGDIPLVGDFNGDGVEQIAVYRGGTWFIDDNGNRELDATDKTFQMGGAGDKPVVGDWDGDGIDEPGLYSDGQSATGQVF